MKRRAVNRLAGASLVGALALLPIAACQGDDETSDQPVVEERPTDPALTDRIAPQVVGHYAITYDVVTQQILPIFGQTDIVARTLELGEIRREGGAFVLVEQACRIEINGVAPVETVIADAVPRSVPMQQSPLLFMEEEGGDIQWERPTVTVVMGAQLADAERDPLPTQASDQRVLDADGDQNPGVTVRVSIAGVLDGTVQVVERRHTSYRGRLTGDGLLTGQVEERSERSIIAASAEALAVPVPSMPHPSPDLNQIRMQRLDGPRDCDRLVAETGPLFP